MKLNTTPTALKDMTVVSFEPLIKQPQSEQVMRESVSYWQGVWRRLRRNLRAFISLWILLLLIVFVSLGSWLWPVSPLQQDLSQISRAPAIHQQAWLVSNDFQWQGEFDSTANTLSADEPMMIVGQANTQRVRLVWRAVADASGYDIYRHILPPSGPRDLGLPLGRVEGVNSTHWQDLLKMEQRTYYYSIRPRYDNKPADNFMTIAAEVVQGITLKQAIASGIASDEQRVQAFIRLPAHPMGTDYLGRDMLSRLIEGGRVSLFIGIVAPLLAILLGAIYGGISGYYGGKVDEILMRFADFVIALPFLLFMILIRVAFGIGPGESGVSALLFALVILGWPGAAKLVRGQVLQLREMPYVSAAKLAGATPIYIVWRHMLPNTLGVLLVSLTFAVPGAIFTEAFLSFIGMGVVPPTASWGAMCNDGIQTFLSSPHELLIPAFFISVTVLAFNLLGDGLRDALDIQYDEADQA